MSVVFSLESPYRGEYRLHRLTFGSGGPVTALVAGIHGNEVNGIHALNLIASMLRLQRVAGTVHLLPCVNLFGAEEARKRWPFDDRDLNEAFPGAADGSPVERIALAVLDASEADVCIELQTGSAAVHEAPMPACPSPAPPPSSAASPRCPSAGVVRPIASTMASWALGGPPAAPRWSSAAAGAAPSTSTTPAPSPAASSAS